MIFSGYLNIADGLIRLLFFFVSFLLFCLFCTKGCRMCWKSTKSPEGLLQNCAAFSASISSKLYLLKAGSLEKIVYMQRWRLCVTPLGKWQTVCNIILTNTFIRSQRITLTNRTWHICCSWFYFFCFYPVNMWNPRHEFACFLRKMM